MKLRKKLIEVALPLDAINKAAAREKSIRHGHPSTLHLWWARRPLAAARAVIFAQMVDDPAEYTDTLLSDPAKKRAAKSELAKRQAEWEERKKKHQESLNGGEAAPTPGAEPTLQEAAAHLERERLFDIIRELVLWENTTNEAVLQQARDEIWQSWRRACADNADHPRAKELFDRNKLPAFHDPFAGGGALPLEAQRLGLEAHASDLNPVAVLINKAMIEIPPKFAGQPPVNPGSRDEKHLFTKTWKGAQGLAEDVRHYGKWMRDEAEKRIGNLYPKIEITAEMAKERPDLTPLIGRKLTVIAWLWARTVKSPNPAFADVDVPLASTFMLSTKPGKEAYVEPVIESGGYRFTVKVGEPKDSEAAENGTKLARGANFKCVMSGSPITGEYIKSEGKAGRMGARLMAIVAEGQRGRVYMAPTPEHEAATSRAEPEWKPEGEVPSRLTGGTCYGYGLTKWGGLFTPRQLVALTTFSELVTEIHERAQEDGIASGLEDDREPLRKNGRGATAYAEAISIYLAFAVSKAADRNSSLCFWEGRMDRLRGTFGRQALPMIWDFAETNPFAGAGGDIAGTAVSVSEVLDKIPAFGEGHVAQSDARIQKLSEGKVVSTDPPYYDNIGYADLSDFFYVWLRRTCRSILPDLFSTLAVPKTEELVASSYRHRSKNDSEAFFLIGMTQAMNRLAEQGHPAFPTTVFYAFRQSETETSGGTASTGWETFLAALSKAGYGVSGTWPVRTEQLAGLKGSISALASSIVLVCRRRDPNAPTTTRRELVSALKAELPHALAHLQRGNIAPVDLAQAAIGPGMAVFTGYSKVIDAEGKPLTVRHALALINQVLDEALAEQEGDFDADTRWALTWFDERGFAEGEYGRAEQLSKTRNTSVEGMREAGILHSKAGKVRLLKPNELKAEWDPTTDERLTVWEMVHHLIRVLEGEGESAAAELVVKLDAKAEVARELAYRLYTLCERKKRAAEALSYNALVQSWPEIMGLVRTPAEATTTQESFI